MTRTGTSSVKTARALIPFTGSFSTRADRPDDAGGLYIIVVSSADSGFGLFTLTTDLNLAREFESFASATNDTPATAQNLNPALTTLGPRIRSAAVTGSFDPLFLADFESGLNGFVVDNSPAGELWHLSTGRGTQLGHSATHSFYFGVGETADGGGTYNTGARAAGYVVSPAISLPTGFAITLDFNYLLRTENSPGFDKAMVQVTNNGGQTWTTLATYNAAAESATWRTSAAINLTNYAGKTVQLRWSFDTIDKTSNAFEGWYVDDVRIKALSSTPDCYAIDLAAAIILLCLPTHRSPPP